MAPLTIAPSHPLGECRTPWAHSFRLCESRVGSANYGGAQEFSTAFRAFKWLYEYLYNTLILPLGLTRPKIFVLSGRSGESLLTAGLEGSQRDSLSTGGTAGVLVNFKYGLPLFMSRA